MKGLFISYRRVDAAGHAGRLFDRLAAHFGKDAVFMDVEGIEAGVDFVEVIEQAVGGCAVLLAVIGRSWLTCVDEQGRRRLDDPQDFIRLEIGSALARKVRVVPVLVEGAQMPPVEALPEDLRPLARLQAVELRDSRWDSDVEALIAVLERTLAAEGAPVRDDSADRRATPSGMPPVASQTGIRPYGIWLGGALALVAAVFVAAYLLRPDATQPRVEDAAVHPAPAPSTAPAGSTTAVAGPADGPTRQVPRPDKSVPTGKGMTREATPAVTPQVVPQAAPAPPPATAAIEPHLHETPRQPVQVTPLPETPVNSGSGAQSVMTRPSEPTPPPRIIAVLARGEPSRRDFWEGESVQTYSAKMATLYSETLQELAVSGVTVKARSGGESI